MANLPAHQQQHRGQMARRTPRHPMDLFRSQIDDLFDRFFGGPLLAFNENGGQMRMWDFGVTENDKEIVVRAEMPGFDEKELDVQLQDDVLTIKAEKEQKSDQEEEYRSFYRTVTVPPGIDPEQVQASYRNGVLELHMPRPQGSQAKRIQLQGQRGGASQASAAESTPKGGNGSKASEKTAAKAAK